jgi:glycosyltransferase involved in cell wall biosynthesis
VDLSICLPLYQQKPYQTINTLLIQAEALPIDYEILIIDDASRPDISAANAEFFLTFPQVRYLILKKNIGRAKIRNKLAAEAKGDYLLCLDGDVAIKQNDFILTYWNSRKSSEILIGGIELGGLQVGCELRWLYAIKREIISTVERQAKPYSSFMTGNFFSDNAIFRKLQFDEEIKGYGHEDTLFGLGLERLNIPIKHLDNSILIEADDENSAFLDKSKEALKNLKTVSEKYPALRHKIGILKLSLKIQRCGMANIFRLVFNPFKHRIYKNLVSKKPSLILFDLYRLNYLLGLDLR